MGLIITMISFLWCSQLPDLPHTGGYADSFVGLHIGDAAYPLYNDDLIRSAANLMGISRIGSAVSALFQNGITLAEKSGRIQNADNGNWILKG